MMQVASKIVIHGDETKRVMQELSKLTDDDQDQYTLYQLVRHLRSKFLLLSDENHKLLTERELKLYPRIEQLLKENASLRTGLGPSSLKQSTRQERADMIMQNDQLKDEREVMSKKIYNLKQNLQTLKQELLHRDDMLEGLKKESRELRHTIHMKTSSRDMFSEDGPTNLSLT